MKVEAAMIPAADVMFRRDNEVLLGRRAGEIYASGFYSIPGGHLEPGEGVVQAGVREMREELGVKINENELSLVHVLHRMRSNDESRVNFIFECWNWRGEPEIMEPEKMDDLLWVPLDQLPENTVAHVCQIINCYQERVLFSEFK